MANKFRISPEAETLVKTFIPLLVAGVAGFTAYNRKLAWQYVALVAVAAWLFSKFTISTTIKTVNTIADKPKAVDIPQGSLPDTFNAKQWADQLKEDIYCTFCMRNKGLYASLAAMNEFQLAAIGNAWNTYYFGLDKESLSVAISGENFGNDWFDNVKANASQVAGRLQQMGL